MRASPEQLHEMLTYCMEFAQTMLEKAGEFYPFGAALDVEGQVVAQGGWDGEEHPNPRDIYQLLGIAFAKLAEERKIKGAALAANVNVPDELESQVRDALRVHLEGEGFSRFIYVPYILTQRGVLWKTRRVEFLDPIPVQIPPALFRGASDA